MNTKTNAQLETAIQTILAEAKAIRKRMIALTNELAESRGQKVETVKITKKADVSPAVPSRKVKPLDRSYMGHQVKFRDGEVGMISGVIDERRMYKVRVKEGRGRPRLIPSTLLKKVETKKGFKLVEITLEAKMAA